MTAYSDKNDITQLYIDSEIVRDAKLKVTVEANDLLLDIKCLIKDYYSATFNEVGNSLKIHFNNGQTFFLTVREAVNQKAL